MPEPDGVAVTRTRRFAITLNDGTILHGVEFPSGRVIADDPIEGLVVAATVADLAPLATSVEYEPEAAEIRTAALEEAATAVEDKAAARLAEIDEDELNPSDHDRYQEWLDAATCVRQAGNTAKETS